MLKLELKNVVKSFQDRVILKIDELRIYAHEVVGIVGLNGAGKTTLLNIMSGQLKPDEGFVRRYGTCSYITQFDQAETRMDQAGSYEEYMSGGEKTRLKLASVFGKDSEILFADEPTANLDLHGILQLEAALKQFAGTVLIVSHDRELLDKLCSKILEIEDGQVRQYTGNYSNYVDQKEQERRTQEFEYEQFVRERSRLRNALVEMQQKSRSVKKTPARMGNSEARLHKMGNQRAKASLDKAVQATKSRLELLKTKERPKQAAGIKLDLQTPEEVHSKVIIEGKNLNKAFGQRIIFANAGFQIRNDQKTAIIGDNGSGKTTLIKMIIAEEEGIRLSRKLKIGYFSQSLDILDARKTIIEDLMESSIYEEASVRTILARLLFKRDEVYKKISVLSGGEKVKVSLAKIVLSDFNLLILDEPTNYLDLYSLEAVEKVLGEYRGNLLFVSHDRNFVNKIATSILLIKNRQLCPFQGNYAQYLEREAEQKNASHPEQRLVLEHRLSELIGRLATPGKNDNIELLDQEYKRILSQLRELD